MTDHDVEEAQVAELQAAADRADEFASSLASELRRMLPEKGDAAALLAMERRLEIAREAFAYLQKRASNFRIETLQRRILARTIQVKASHLRIREAARTTLAVGDQAAAEL